MIRTIFFALSLLSLSSSAFAGKCGSLDFDGQWISRDGGNIQVSQLGCDSLGFTDNINKISYDIPFDSKKETPLPQDYFNFIGRNGNWIQRFLKRGSYTATIAKDSQGSFVRLDLKAMIGVGQREIHLKGDALISLKKAFVFDGGCDSVVPKKRMHIWVGNIRIDSGLEGNTNAAKGALKEVIERLKAKSLEQFSASFILENAGP